MIKTLLLASILLSSFKALAEYRVYQYIVKSNDPFAVATKAESQYLTSTLNPQMFKSYHGGSRISVDLLRTWICPGYTGRGQKTCDHPYDREPKVQ